MWKSITRPLRELIEKRANFPTRDKKTNPAHSRTECCSYILQKNLSSLCSILHYNHSEKNVFEPTNFPKDKYYQQNRKEKKSRSTTYNYAEVDDSQSIFGTLTGSSILVLGWYLSQPNYWKRLICKSPETNNNSSRSSYEPQKYVPLTTLITRVAYAQPVGPIKPKDIKPSHETTVPKHYIPPTAEETINVTAHKFRNVHVTALGTLENNLGIECMKNKKFQEAKDHFEKAAGLQSTPALFNLGLFYEEQQNLNQAVHYYSLASQKGHPEAKYNLGVLHAKGLGGLKQDRYIATCLIKEAASLGQQQALDTLRKIEPESHSEIMAEKTNRILQEIGIHEDMTTRSRNKVASKSIHSMSLTELALLVN